MNRMQVLVLGAMPADAGPETHLAAGPWAFAGQEEAFPDWDQYFTMAAEPLADPGQLEPLARTAQALAVDSMPAIAASLCRHSHKLPESYWETLLAPWICDAAIQILERWQRVKSLVATYGRTKLEVAVLPEACSFGFADEHEFVLHGALGHNFNHWLFSRLLDPVWPKAWEKRELPPVHEVWPEQQAASPSLREKIRQALCMLQLRLPFPRLKGMGTGQALAFSRALRHASPGQDRSLSLTRTYGSLATGFSHDLPLDPLNLLAACLPRTLADLRHPEQIRQTARPRLRVASVIAYEDTAYRQKLAIWRAAGNRLAYVQHGGNYGQVSVTCTTALVEYSQHAFITWGWKEHQGSMGNFLPLPPPQLASQANAWHRKSDDLIYVGTEMPAYAYRLDSHPTPCQVVAYRAAKQRFLAALPENILARTKYRPYFDVPGTFQDTAWLLPKFPELGLCTGPLMPQVMGCHLLVLDHHGTTMLEAMAANVPLVAYWNRAHWPLAPGADKLLDALEAAGIYCPDPETAASRVAEVFEDPAEWWHSAATQQARLLFCHNFAQITGGNVDPLWKQTLARL